MSLIVLLTGLAGCAGRTAPQSIAQAGQCVCECDPARGSYSYSTALHQPYQSKRTAYRANRSRATAATRTPPAALPPVVSSRYRGNRNISPPRQQSKPSSKGYATNQYRQTKADALRSAKRRGVAKKRVVKKKKSTHKQRRHSSAKKTSNQHRHHASTKKATKKTQGKKTKKQKTAKPYKVLGEWYTPLATAKGYKAEGKASWYGKRFHGGPTASGEKFDMNALTAAHKTLPFNSKVRITNLETKSNIIVRINDRGPFRKGYLIDVSAAAADRLGFNGNGSIKVRVEGVE